MLSEADALNLLSNYLRRKRGNWELARAGRYSFIRLLGSGGMGLVFQCVDELRSEMVAWKTLRPDILSAKGASERDKLLQRFANERKTQRRIDSGYVVRLRDSGSISPVGSGFDLPFMSLEFVAGRTLRNRLEDPDPITRQAWRCLPQLEACRIARDICFGLKAIHAVVVDGVPTVHRDLKPENVILASAQAGRARVADFGTAWSNEIALKGLTAHWPPGTIYYTAPERIAHPSTPTVNTPAVDVFSLGVILYEMLTGQVPFTDANQSAPNLIAIATAISNSTPVAPRAVHPTLDAELSALTLRLLEKRPADRPTIDEVERSLNAILDRAPVDVGPQTAHWPRMSPAISAECRERAAQSLNIPVAWTGIRRGLQSGIAWRLRFSSECLNQTLYIRDKLLGLAGELRESLGTAAHGALRQTWDEAIRTLQDLRKLAFQTRELKKELPTAFNSLRSDIDRVTTVAMKIDDIHDRMRAVDPTTMPDLRRELQPVCTEIKALLYYIARDVEPNLVSQHDLGLDRMLVALAT